MKRLTKSQYEMIAQVFKETIDDRLNDLHGSDRRWREKALDDINLMGELVKELASKFMYSDTEFKYKEFMNLCGLKAEAPYGWIVDHRDEDYAAK